MSIPGVGAVTATALVALAPPPAVFRRGRDFAAWVGLTALQHSSGGKEKLGKITKMGERSLRRLLIIGASAAAAKEAPLDSWLARMLSRKARMLVVVALANKMAHRLGADGAWENLQSPGLGGAGALPWASRVDAPVPRDAGSVRALEAREPPKVRSLTGWTREGVFRSPAGCLVAASW